MELFIKINQIKADKKDILKFFYCLKQKNFKIIKESKEKKNINDENKRYAVIEKRLAEETPNFLSHDELILSISKGSLMDVEEELKLYSFFSRFNNINSLILEKKLNYFCFVGIIKSMRIKYISKNLFLEKFGDPYTNTYLILDGEIEAIGIIRDTLKLTENQYISHLIKLKNLNESSLLKKNIDANFHKYPVNDKILEKLYELNVFLNIQLSKSERNRIDIYAKIKSINTNNISILFDNTPMSDTNQNSNNQTIDNSTQNNNANTSKYSSKFSFDTLEYKHLRGILEFHETLLNSYNEQNGYILRSKIYNINADNDLTAYNKKIDFDIFSYKTVSTLKEGSLFNDIIYAKHPNFFTFKSKSDCILLTFSKENYTKQILPYIFEGKKSICQFVKNLPCFKNVRYEKFEKMIFKYVLPKNIYQGEMLIKQDDILNSIYFIKNGSFSVSINVSLIELIRLFSTPEFKFFKSKFDEYFTEELLEKLRIEKIFEKFSEKRINYELFVYDENELIGLNDFLFDSNVFKSLFTVKCLSKTNEIFEIDREVFYKFTDIDNAFKEDLKNYENSKRGIFLERIIKICFLHIEEFEDNLLEKKIFKKQSETKKKTIYGERNRRVNIEFKKLNKSESVHINKEIDQKTNLSILDLDTTFTIFNKKLHRLKQIEEEKRNEKLLQKEVNLKKEKNKIVQLKKIMKIDKESLENSKKEILNDTFFINKLMSEKYNEKIMKDHPLKEYKPLNIVKYIKKKVFSKKLEDIVREKEEIQRIEKIKRMRQASLSLNNIDFKNLFLI